MDKTARGHEEEWREHIFNAFNDCLAAGTPYSEVTVKRICDEAHISKPTFYRYFKNKEDMSIWVTCRCIDAGFAQIGRTCTWFVGYYRTCLMYLKYKAFFSRVAFLPEYSKSRSATLGYIRETLISTITEYRKQELEALMAFQIEALLLSSRSLLQFWGESGMTMPPEEMAAYMTSVVPWGLYNLLLDPVEGTAEPRLKINHIAINSLKGRTLSSDLLKDLSENGTAALSEIMMQARPKAE